MPRILKRRFGFRLSPEAVNKSDYNFAVLIMVLSVISGLIQGTVYLALGNHIFFQDFFIPWLFLLNVIYFAGVAIPVCGEGDTTLASEITGVAVWAFHGEKDENVPVSGSRDMIKAMEAAGKSPKYTEYQNEAHNIWYQVSTEPDLWPWLFSQRKE